MPKRQMTEKEISNLLKGEATVHIAFFDRDFPYVIPFGYVYLGTTLYGICAPGRKTRLAEANPRVGFQVDSSARTGVWEWESVAGEGSFELVKAEEEQRKALSALESWIARAPAWWQEEIRPPVAKGIVKVWKITPTQLAGVQYLRP